LIYILSLIIESEVVLVKQSGNGMANISVLQKSILGIDIGSVSLYIVQMDTEGNILRRFCQFHKGNIRAALSEAGKIFDLSQISGIACTANSVCLNKKLVHTYNAQVALMAAARHFCPDAVSVLHVGAEKFMLIKFDADGNYKSARVNSSCAAGTGSFLDQQALRLNLSGVEELCEKALST
jgi:activator of 2-hydroxyglutaryl-CoA dehydratase